MKSDAGRAAYWRMNYESAIQALADLIAENTENVEFARDFYRHNADLMSDYWRTRWTTVFPPAAGSEYGTDICTHCGDAIEERPRYSPTDTVVWGDHLGSPFCNTPDGTRVAHSPSVTPTGK